MDTNASQPDDLNDLERRLSNCRPSAEGLDAEAMLFAAGRAAARPGPARFVWPGVAGCFALLAVALGTLLASERSERLALARQLQEQRPAALPPPAPLEATAPTQEALPGSLLAAHRSLQQDFDAWLASAGPAPVPSQGPAFPSPPIPRAWSPRGLEQ
jgi:hypothetical protein